MRGLIRAAVRLCAALAPAIGALDLGGVSWRRLRAFQRGAACLSFCAEGHTYGPWCQMGWPLPGPTYLMHAVAEATMPLPEPAQRLNDETIRAIHAALTEVALAELPEEPVDTVVEEIDIEPAEVQRIAEHLAEHPLVEAVHLVHHPACACLPDVEGKAGPCDCGAEP